MIKLCSTCAVRNSEENSYSVIAVIQLQSWPHPVLPVSPGARILPSLLGQPMKQTLVMSVVLT